MNKFFGNSLCEGIVSGKLAYVQDRSLTSSFSSYEKEIDNLNRAVEEVKKSLSLLFASLSKKRSTKAEMINVLLAILDDSDFINEIIGLIKEGNSTEKSLKILSARYFNTRDEDRKDLLKQNFTNVIDICSRLIDYLRNDKIDLSKLNEKIVISENIHVSHLLDAIDNNINIKGFILKDVSYNSHLSTIIRSLNIPAISGVDIKEIATNYIEDEVILDSRIGFESIIFSADRGTKEFYLHLLSTITAQQKDLKYLENRDSITKDGTKISLKSNILNMNQIAHFNNSPFDGLGLVRTEMLFTKGVNLPNQDEQLECYKKLLNRFGSKPINIRMLDIGVDKYFDRLTSEEIEISSLGIRGARFLLKNINIAKIQMKAILRFSALADVMITYPFVTNITEIIQLNKLLEKCKEELGDENYKFDSNIKIGCFIENASSAIMADHIIDLVDEVFIGLNDLTQYIVAASRFNKSVEYLCDVFDSSILRAVYNVINYGKERGKKVSICGEAINSDIGFTSMLILGSENFVINNNFLLRAKEIINKIDLTKINELRDYIINSGSHETNKSIMSMFLSNGL